MNVANVGTTVFKPLSDAELTQFRSLVAHMLSGAVAAATVLATPLGMVVDTVVESPSATFYIVRENLFLGAVYRATGTFIFRDHATWTRNIVGSVPHVDNDSGTSEGGMVLLTRGGARALFITGCHRCNSCVASGEAGKTTMCSAASKCGLSPRSQPFRISDAAHYRGSFFHHAHLALAEAKTQAVMVQLHGAADSSLDAHKYGTDAIISDGSQRVLVEGDRRHVVGDAVAAQGFSVALYPSQASKLGGTANSQGRSLLWFASGMPTTT